MILCDRNCRKLAPVDPDKFMKDGGCYFGSIAYGVICMLKFIYLFFSKVFLRCTNRLYANGVY